MNKSFPIQNLQEGGEIDPSVDPRTGSKFPLSRQGQIWKETLSQMGKNIQAAAKKRKEQQKPQQPQQQQEMQEGGQVQDDEQQTVPPMTPEEFDRLYRIMLERDEINRKKAMNEPQGYQLGGGIGRTFVAPSQSAGGNKIGPPHAGGGGTPGSGGFPWEGAGLPAFLANYWTNRFGSPRSSTGQPIGQPTPISSNVVDPMFGRLPPGQVPPIGRMPPGQVPPSRKDHRRPMPIQRNPSPFPIRFQQGGETNTDTVPIMATPGEFVLNRGAVETAGRPFLHALNEMGKEHPAMMRDGGDIEPGPLRGTQGIGDSIRGQDVQQAMDVLAEEAQYPIFTGDPSTNWQPTLGASGYGGGQRFEDMILLNSLGGGGGSNWGFGSGLTSPAGLSMGGIGGFGGTLFGSGGGGVGNTGRALLQQGGPVPNRPRTFPVQMQGQGMNPQALGQMIGRMLNKQQGFEGARNMHMALRARHSNFQPQQMAQPQRRRRQPQGYRGV